ncbi:MAG: molybdopterin-dependent oxidoreductase [Deltaproteobacteria bacterium]|jgi:xanthine dehydrogenase molybdenum-binding subunit|nr:molybdopterin-dependent oxidoreductase [Deltaproteobacteria bacterium]
MAAGYRHVGRDVPRPDGPDKVRGRYPYLADEIPSGALRGSVVLSAKANAVVVKIDVSRALRLPGVVVLTPQDAPRVKYNGGEWFPGQDDHPDETVLTGHARHVGDRIALVLAPDKKTSLEARGLLAVEYEDLPPVADLLEAADKAGLLHEDGVASFPGKIEYGDPDKAFAEAFRVEEDVVSTQKIHHAAMEPHAVLALPRPGGVVEIRTPCQIMFGVQHVCARVLGLPLSRVRVLKTPMGGSFGGKQEAVLEPLCAWAALRTGKPVFIGLSREETILSTRTRAASLIRVRTALDRDGRIAGRKITALLDGGAYLTGSRKVLMAMGKKVPRLYKIPALRFEGEVVRTSTTPAGACRGYGSPQIHAAAEIHADLLCRRLGLDPVAFRLDNLVDPGGRDPSGAADLGNARIKECLETGLAAFGWDDRKEPESCGRLRRGAGFACCTHGNGYFKTVYHDESGMSLRLLEDGSAVLRSGVHELGNDAAGCLAQIAAEELGIPPGLVTVLEGDTLANSYDIGCQASRGVFVMGECARLAAAEAAAILLREAEKLMGGPVRLDGGTVRLLGPPPAGASAAGGAGALPLGECVRLVEMKNAAAVEAHVRHSPRFNPASYGVHFVGLAVDTLSGLVKIERYLAVHDVGLAVNPQGVRGQIYGGVQMGLGMALTEELAYDSLGRPMARNFDKYHLVNAPDMPDVEVILVERGEEGGPYGAKSIGEIATVPTAPAVANAVNRALGTSITTFPFSPARIVASLAELGGGKTW